MTRQEIEQRMDESAREYHDIHEPEIPEEIYRPDSPDLSNASLAHLKYVSVSTGVQTAEFYYQPLRWFHPYRFVVIRRPQPEESDQQLTLFKLGSYHYQVLVTNLDLRPLNLWRFYNGRARIERIIRELKGDYPLGKIPTRHFLANEVYLHLLLLAYNLVNWFKRLVCPGSFRPLRSILCAIAFC
jgi:hypothetical protein